MTHGRARLVVLASGSGTNAQALLDASAAGELCADVARIISNKPRAGVLERARRAQVPTVVHSLRPLLDAGGTRTDYDVQMATLINEATPDLVVLAGFMLVLGPAALDRLTVPVLNLHPALPGAFAGTAAIERAHAAFLRGEIHETGVMVHHVVAEIDAGPVVAHTRVPIATQDTVATLRQRIQAAEHPLLVSAVAKVLAERPSPPPPTP